MSASRVSIADLRRAAAMTDHRGGAWRWNLRQDALTGLIDRAGLNAAIDRLYTEERRFGLVLAEIDRLRSYNEAFGRSTGDKMLYRLAHNLTNAIDDQALIARIGGARFGLILPDIEDIHALALAANDIAGIVTQTVVDRRSAVTLGCVVGAALAPDDAESGEALYRKAEIALFSVRVGVKSQTAVFRPTTLTTAVQSVAESIERQNFSLTFQPVVSLGQPNQIFAIECFLRWLHPARGLLFPNDFQGLMEEPGSAELIGGFAVDAAAAQAAQWLDRGFEFGRMSVNLSNHLVRSPELPEMVFAALDRHALPPARLMLEVPEAVRLRPLDRARVDGLMRLRAAGVAIALDGFSGSLASMDELSVVPFDVLKLDRGYTQDPYAAEMLRELLAMAPARGVDIVLEGIEDGAAIPHLKSMGARYAQGYLFRRPMTGPKLEEWLRPGPGAAD